MLNLITVEGPIAKIHITMKDGTPVTAIIDAEDVDLADKYRWHAAKQRDSFRIVCHKRTEPKGKKQAFYLHRIVTDAPCDKFVDHINCEPTDNRKINLRFTDYRGNGQNRKLLHSTNTTGVKNVTFHKRDLRYQAVMQSNGKRIFIGYFENIDDAERAVIAARKKYMPYSQEAQSTVNNATPY